MNIKDLEDKVVQHAISNLEEDRPPWHKPWTDDGTVNPLMICHRNGATGHVYSGINWFITQMSGYESNEWFTKRQAVELSSEDKPIPYEEFKKGTAILFYKPVFKTEDGVEEFAYRVQRIYTIWNREQINGLPESTLDKPEDFDPHTEIEKMLESLNLKGGINIGGDRACYVPAKDAICLPQDSAFTDENERESTKAHEGIHATGAKHRLARKKDSYAFEELVAELGAAMVCASLGVHLDKLQHTSYIKSWLKCLKNDKQFIFKAAAQANKAVRYLTGASNG